MFSNSLGMPFAIYFFKKGLTMKTAAILLVLFSLSAMASEKDFMDLARTRKYRGGADESDLKVQAVLYQAPNKKKKAQKAEEPVEGF
jgi:ATP-dependent Zn protease